MYAREIVLVRTWIMDLDIVASVWMAIKEIHTYLMVAKVLYFFVSSNPISFRFSKKSYLFRGYTSSSFLVKLWREWDLFFYRHR